MLAVDAAVGTEHLKLIRQPFGRLERAAIVPEVGIVALRRLVMQDQEVADVDIFLIRLLR